jgi:predicted metal-dependent hydrolase
MRRGVRSHTLAAGNGLVAPIPTAAFKDEVRSWAMRLEVEPLQIHLVRMSRKWASWSPRGRVTFDLELLHQPEEFRREVIIHELLHFKVPNHGPLFSALLRTYMAAAE